jgi:hypothetical protein
MQIKIKKITKHIIKKRESHYFETAKIAIINYNEFPIVINEKDLKFEKDEKNVDT